MLSLINPKAAGAVERSEMETKIEYRVRPVTRYIVTRFEQEYDPAGISASAGFTGEKGEFPNFDTAYAVAYALCKAEHERLGYPLDDERIKYPAPGPGEKLDRTRLNRKLPDESAA